MFILQSLLYHHFLVPGLLCGIIKFHIKRLLDQSLDKKNSVSAALFLCRFVFSLLERASLHLHALIPLSVSLDTFGRHKKEKKSEQITKNQRQGNRKIKLKPDERERKKVMVITILIRTKRASWLNQLIDKSDNSPPTWKHPRSTE